MTSPSDQDITKTATPPDGSKIASDIARLGMFDLETTNDDLLQLRETLIYMKRTITDQLNALEQAMIDRNVSATIGTRRIFVGTKKDTKCRAIRPALEALLQCCGGDWDEFANALSSNAIKYGAAKQVMPPDVWAAHFEVVEKMELRDGEEKPVRQLVDVDEQFIKKGK